MVLIIPLHFILQFSPIYCYVHETQHPTHTHSPPDRNTVKNFSTSLIFSSQEEIPKRSKTKKKTGNLFTWFSSWTQKKKKQPQTTKTNPRLHTPCQTRFSRETRPTVREKRRRAYAGCVRWKQNTNVPEVRGERVAPLRRCLPRIGRNMLMSGEEGG